MHICGARIEKYKGVDVELPWASAIVLFGANDSGKTNILEAFLANLGDGRAVRGEGDAELGLDIELDGLHTPGHPDQELFLTMLLSYGEGPFWLESESWVSHSGVDSEVVDELQRGWDDLQRDYASLGSGEDRTSRIAKLVERAFSLAAANWDQYVGTSDVPTGLSVPRSGREAVASCAFRAYRGSLAWFAPGGADIVYLGCPYLPNRENASYLDMLGVRVVRVDASTAAFATIYERLERAMPTVAVKHRRFDHAFPAANLGHLDPTSLDVRAILRGDIALTPDREKQPWLIREGNLTALRPSMQAACEEFSTYVTGLAAPFVSSAYDIRIVPLHPDEWPDHDGRHLGVCLRSHRTGQLFDLESASSGMATWTGFALSETLRLAEEGSIPLLVPWFTEDTADPSGVRDVRYPSPLDQPPEALTVYVFDEPETHLHPLAQQQAADWIAERARTGANVLLASHALPFLDMPLKDVEYLKVTRNEEWETKAERITGDILGAVAKSAADLGLPPVALVQLTKAWLVVEGEHDRLILNAFFGEELRRAGLQILPLRGAARAKASFMAVEALKPLCLPFFWLLDNTYARRLEDKTGSEPKTQEEFIAAQLKRLAAEEGTDLRMLTWPYPDIICALPIEAVRRLAFEKRGTPDAATSWQELIERHEIQRREAEENGKKPADFKGYVLETFQLKGRGADWFVNGVLRLCEQRSPDGCPLTPVVSSVIAAVEARVVAPVHET